MPSGSGLETTSEVDIIDVVAIIVFLFICVHDLAEEGLT